MWIVENVISHNYSLLHAEIKLTVLIQDSDSCSVITNIDMRLISTQWGGEYLSGLWDVIIFRN